MAGAWGVKGPAPPWGLPGLQRHHTGPRRGPTRDRQGALGITRKLSVSSEKLPATLQRLPKGFISFPVTTPNPQLMKWIQVPLQVSNIANVSDGLSTDQAYKIAKHVMEGSKENMIDPSKLKLVNTGTIDPFHIQWGEKKIKFLGFEGRYPIVNSQFLQERFPKRAIESSEITVGIAGLSTKIEAV